MQSTGKDDLPGNDLKEDVSDKEVKAKDRDKEVKAKDSSGPDICASAPHTQNMKQKITCCSASAQMPQTALGCKTSHGGPGTTLVRTGFEGRTPA